MPLDLATQTTRTDHKSRWSLVVFVVAALTCTISQRAHAKDDHGPLTPPQVKEGTRLVVHKALGGDSLVTIAQLYGVPASDIRSWNQLDRTDLSAGQLLWILRPIRKHRPTMRPRPQSTSTWTPGTQARPLGHASSRSRWSSVGKAVGAHNNGRLIGGAQIAPGLGYVVRKPSESYGTGRTINLVQRCVRKTRRANPGMPPVVIGDISLRHGGPFRPHKSHQNGLDVDVGYVSKKKSHHGKYFYANRTNLDRYRSWKLIQCFVEDPETKMIFMDHDLQREFYAVAKRLVGQKEADRLFQYPAGPKTQTGVIRHSPGHVNHFHVRVRKSAPAAAHAPHRHPHNG